MTPDEFEALFTTPPQGAPQALPQATPQAAPQGPAPQTPAAVTTGPLTPEQFDALFDGPAPTAPTASAPAPQSSPQAPPDAPASSPGIMTTIGSVASDIGTGITELPQAVLKGGRDAVQETMNFVADAAGYAIGETYKAPTLPDLSAPTSVTGGLVKGVSQFLVGMIGVGKITKPLQAASGLAKAGRAAKVGVETAKAATVGAVAFDPKGPRLSDLVESIPGASNPITAYLKSDPTDTAAEGRVKNALESIGMDAALIGGVMVSTRLYKALAEYRAGNVSKAELDAAMAQAEAYQGGGSVEGGPTLPVAREASSPTTSPLPDADPVAPTTAPDTAATPTPTGTTTPAVTPSTTPRDVLDLASGPTPKRDVLNLGSTPQAPTPSLLEATPESTQAILKALSDDASALASAGSWDGAVAAGHTFGRGVKVPWQKLAMEEGVEGDGLKAFVARLSDELQAGINATRGGDAKGVLSDARVNAMVQQRARLWGDDPAEMLGRLTLAGENARGLAADMEASFLIAQRAMQDSYSMAARIKAGDLTEFGGNPQAATDALRDMLSISSTLFANAQAMRSGAGRSLRRMREEFAPSPEELAALRGLDPGMLVDAVVATGGDPRSLRKLSAPTVAQRMTDYAQFLYINNLLWSPRTHAVNLMTNTYQVLFRPVERMVGSAILEGGTSGRAFKESQKQYAYMGASLTDALHAAAQAWSRGDSVIAPHTSHEAFRQAVNSADFKFRPVETFTDLLHNALAVPMVKLTGIPTRALGTVDELVKQVVYRSKVQAKAHVDGVEMGLEGDALSTFVRERLHGAFDDQLRATDQAALQEARIATFQQDLLEGTFGKTVQDAVAKHSAARFVLPFVRTPMNVLRYGVKLTPGLNLAQEEYRMMLRGTMGREAQAQAVGQMSVGAIFLSTAAYLASSGTITGGGPSDPNLKASLQAAGWKPYSLVTVNADGSRTYTAIGRFDPIALPFGIVADVVDALNHAYEEGDDDLMQLATDAASGALIGVVKQMAEKSYLRSLNDAIRAFMQPEPHGKKTAGGIAANFVPFSSALNFVNPDPHLREARELTDHLISRVPGLSSKLPAKRDAFGDPITTVKGLWSTGDRDLVEAEMRRMALLAKGQNLLSRPSPVIEEVDLRDITTSDGKNAYEVYQQLVGRPSPGAPPLKAQLAKIIASEAYRSAPDGAAELKGTKASMAAGIIAQYRQTALRRLRADPVVRKALFERQEAIIDHYKGKRAEETKRQEDPAADIKALGKAFGIDFMGVPRGQ